MLVVSVNNDARVFEGYHATRIASKPSALIWDTRDDLAIPEYREISFVIELHFKNPIKGFKGTLINLDGFAFIHYVVLLQQYVSPRHITNQVASVFQ